MTNSHLTDEAAGTGEQVTSPAVRRRLQQCFEHGSKLMKQQSYDFDYAHTMFVECEREHIARVPASEDLLRTHQLSAIEAEPRQERSEATRLVDVAASALLNVRLR